MDPEQLKAFAAEVEKRLKAEGFSTIADLVTAYQSALADKDKAVEARDKFSASLEEARKELRSRGGEMGTLKQEIVQLKEQLAAAPGTVPKAPDAPPPATKTLDEQLSELEGSLTDAQWKAADEILSKMTDDEALTFTSSKKDRLEFLTGLRNDPALKSVVRPKSFRAPAVPAPAPAGESAYDQLVKRVRGTGTGPSGAPSPSRTGAPAGAGSRPSADWLK
jgi:hypothetical protein